MAERRLAAIMFTDLAGFTAMGQEDERKALKTLEVHRGLLRPLFAKHGGREVKTIGDAFLVEFASAVEAVLCAVEAQSAVHKHNLERGDSIRVRIGVHLGDVLRKDGDLLGDAVNVASRIEPLAPPGGICVSKQVEDQTRGKTPYPLASIGPQALKNVKERIEVFLVVLPWEDKTPLRAASRDRIAVLPLRSISPDPGDEYFADGMTEELISSISRIGGVGVIARTSVMRFKGKDTPVSQIARELGVRRLLEGSVRKQGDRVRINVQLVDASTEEQSWSEEYDREIRDVFEIQRDISREVASALRVRALEGELQEIGRDGTAAPQAYVDYLRGRQLLSRRTGPDLLRSLSFFNDALRADPRFVKAYSGLADSYATLALLELMPPSEAFPKAKEAVLKALAVDGRVAEPHTSLALTMFQYDWDWRGAEDEFLRASALNPNYPPAHQFYADYLKAMGRFDEALGEMKRASELDPLSLAISAGLGHILYLSRDYDAAIRQYRKTVEMDPSFMQTHLWFGRPYLEKGLYPEAIGELETAVKLSGESTLALGMLGHGLASAGRKEEAQAVLDKLLARSRDEYVSSYWVAAVYNGMKLREQTLEWLRKAVRERSSWLVWVNVEPRFDWLRDDPGFGELLGEMKFSLQAR